jgi:putative mRNA 3-end processing factor
MQLVEFTSKGLFCPAGGFYIDPWLPVDKAVITHAHSDHASAGSREYLAHPLTAPLLRQRLGNVNVSTLEWGEATSIHGVKISFHPAGHIIGSSQVRVEYQGEVWVFSGDYKLANDGLSGEFEPVKCHTFITESTFGLPIYKWKPQQQIYDEIRNWIRDTHSKGKIPVITGYSLGKAQRLIHCISEITNRIYAHGAVWNMQDALRRAHVPVTPVVRVTHDIPKEEYFNSVIVAPPGAEGSSWLNRFNPWSIASCSGWMQVRGNVRRKNVDAAFALSDHADWDGLLQTVRNTGAPRVYVTHGFQEIFSRYLNEQGIEAIEVKTAFKGEEPPPEEKPGEEEEKTE